MRRWFAPVAIVMLLLAGCADDDATVRSNDTGNNDGGTTTTCVSAPATTAMGMKGGGEIVCGPVGDTTDSSPVTTIPPTTAGSDGY